jgi:ABC-type branched-subunit amino acid transport system substrate-binding protein
MVMTGEFISRRTALKTMASSAAILGAGIGTIGTLRAAETIKIGFLSGMTGLETILGETQLNCFKLAVEEINAAGAAGDDISTSSSRTIRQQPAAPLTRPAS